MSSCAISLRPRIVEKMPPAQGQKKELRERIAEVEKQVAQFNSGRAALWGQVEAAFNALDAS